MMKMNLSLLGGGGGAQTARGVKRGKGAPSLGTAAKRARAALGGGKKNLAARQSAAMSEYAGNAPKRKR